ncbi:hypothetical protein JTB14_032072 [Gonioctena quinquepunctata]|nr:hypothetical protein JTB14_032072 [Gonioctena quinquepunctata]
MGVLADIDPQRRNEEVPVELVGAPADLEGVPAEARGADPATGAVVGTEGKVARQRRGSDPANTVILQDPETKGPKTEEAILKKEGDVTMTGELVAKNAR